MGSEGQSGTRVGMRQTTPWDAASQEENESFEHDSVINKNGHVARVARVTSFPMLGLQGNYVRVTQNPYRCLVVVRSIHLSPISYHMIS